MASEVAVVVDDFAAADVVGNAADDLDSPFVCVLLWG